MRRRKEAGLRLAGRRAARLRRRHARHPRLSAGPRRLGQLTRLLLVGKLRGEKGECILASTICWSTSRGSTSCVMPLSTPPARPGHLCPGGGGGLARGRCRRALGSARASWRRARCGSAPACSIAATTRRLARPRRSPQPVVPLIAVGDVLYQRAERRPLQDVVTCIREHVTIDQAGRRLEANAERHLKAPQEMARLFRAAPRRSPRRSLSRALRLLAR